MLRLAWFSPMPPVRTGVAVYSAEIVAALRDDYEVDVFTDYRSPGSRPAHDFIWEHQQRPYDLPVYQLGNSSFHDYIWPYLFRYPGLTVLHDAHLHHARAAQLLRVNRTDDYRAEFAANHPGVPVEMAELAVAGFDSYLYYLWPLRRLVVQASRATAVHTKLMADDLRDECPDATVETIRLAHGERVNEDRVQRARASIRPRYGLAEGAVVFGVFGALTPDKRIPQVLDAFVDVRPFAPAARLMLAGPPAAHYDLAADIERRNLGASIVQTGYVSDDELTDHLAACDVSLNLRWPTAREMSGPWLRALAVGLPTIVIDLAHTADIPALDPRTWTPSHAAEPVAVVIDILDEAHSLRLAMRRLAADAELRTQLGAAAAAYWRREHSMERMVDDYRAVVQRVIASPPRAPSGDLPSHLTDRGDRHLEELLHPFGLGGTL